MCVHMQILAAKNCKSERFPNVDDCFRDLKPLFPRVEMPIYESVEGNYNQNWKANTPKWIKISEDGFKEYLDGYYEAKI